MDGPCPSVSKGWFPVGVNRSAGTTGCHEHCQRREKGYILEVDLEYPAALHDLHSDYPVAPERKTVAKEELSPYSQQLLEELKLKGKPTEKLIPNLNDKSKYVVHYYNLQQYLQLGLKLTKIHRAIVFNQSKWLQPYISFNTEMRKAAKNPFEKTFTSL